MSLLSGWWTGRGQFGRLWQTEVSDHIIALAWSPDDRHVAAAAVSGPVAILDAETGAPRHTLSGHRFGTTAVAWMDGGTVVTAGHHQECGRTLFWPSAVLHC